MRLGRVRFEAKYLAIQHFHAEKGWSIRWMCRQLGISKAAYYKWLHRSVPQAEQENLVLAELIREYDEQYNHILGYRRMTAWINRLNGTCFSKNRIHRIMQAINVHSVIRKQPKKYRKSTPERTAENVLKRDFNASSPNEKWVTDVTEFKWYEGPVCHKLYLSAILDLYDRSVVSHVISRRNDNKLVFQTFDKAIANNPDAKPIFHSDRGFQYTGRVFQTKLTNQEMEQSMSRVGRCIDNGPTEGFWGIIKSEMYYLQTFKDEKSLRSAIEKYIHFYNYERFQERFETRTPMEVRTEALNSDAPALYPIPENKRIQRKVRCIKKLTVPEKGNGEHNRTIFYLFLRSTLTGADQFGAPLCEDSLFLFCGRRTDRIKALYFSGDGYVLLYKRLNNGAFQWPRSEQELRLLDKRSFRWLMEGLKPEQPKAIQKCKKQDLF